MSGIGPSKANIMIVMDSPLVHSDDQEGVPAAGDSGNKLRYLLSKSGIKFRQVYITHAIKCATRKSLKADHLKSCRKHLLSEVQRVRPKIIIAMGNKAIESLILHKNVKDVRGHFYPVEIKYKKKGKRKIFTTWVIPTYSANAALAKWEYDEILIHDMKKVLKFSKDQQLPEKLPVKYELVTSLETLAKVEKELVSAKRFTYDFETTGLKFNQHDVVMVGFCPRPGRVIIVPRFIYTKEHFTSKWTDDESEFAEKVSRFVKKNATTIDDALKRIFASLALKIAHNGKFDNKFAKHFGYPVKKFFFDTIIAHALINENLPHNLTFLLEWYGINHLSDNDYGPYENDLWFYINKTKQNRKPYSFIPVKKLASYLAKDCDGDYRLYQKLKPELKQEGFWKLMMKQQMVVSDIMADVEFHGFKLHVEGLQDISRKFSSQLEKIESSLKKLAGSEFNPASSKQVLGYLESKDAPFDEIGKKTKGGSYSTDEDAMKMMARKRKFKKFCNLILDHREIAKMKGTYLDGKDGASGILKHVGPTGKVHANWNIHTPRTGRLSCSDPALHQLPRPSVKYPWANIRKLFIPSRLNWAIWEVDYKMLEMRIASWFSKDWIMIDEIGNGADLHTRNAIMFNEELGFLESAKGISEDEYKKRMKYTPPNGWEKMPAKKKEKIEEKMHMAREYTETRVFAKELGFGVGYGMDAKTLADNHNKPVDEVEEAIAVYFRKYEGYDRWRDKQKKLWLAQGFQMLPWTGRRRRFHMAAEWFNSHYSENCWKRQMDMEATDRQAMNFPIQGFANEVFTRGKINLRNALRENKFKSQILLSLHDGIIGEGPLNEMIRLEELCKENMEVILSKGKKHEVPLDVDFEVYDRWKGNKIDYRKVTKLRKAL